MVGEAGPEDLESRIPNLEFRIWSPESRFSNLESWNPMGRPKDPRGRLLLAFWLPDFLDEIRLCLCCLSLNLRTDVQLGDMDLIPFRLYVNTLCKYFTSIASMLSPTLHGHLRRLMFYSGRWNRRQGSA